jgi:RNA polymerase subunit RPABC4/transcription elongation factor Spt4
MTDLVGPYMPYITLAMQLCGVFYVVFRLSLIFWVARDAQRRGAMAWFWGVASLFFGEAAWAVYMVVRPPETLDDAHERELETAAREAELQRVGMTCPHCFKPIESDYLICPTCMKKLKKPCTNCGRPVKTSWSVCPYCKARQVPGDRVAGDSEAAADSHAESLADAAALAETLSTGTAPKKKNKKPAFAGDEA